MSKSETTITRAKIEAAARAMCEAWGYNWTGDPDDSQTAPEAPADAYDDRPSKGLYRKAAKAALEAASHE